jgi:hypothetical protein
MKKGTHWRERVASCRCGSEYDVGVIVPVNAKKALKCRLISKTAGELETTNLLASATSRCSIKDESCIQLLYPEWLHMLPASYGRQEVTKRCPAKLSQEVRQTHVKAYLMLIISSMPKSTRYMRDNIVGSSMISRTMVSHLTRPLWVPGEGLPFPWPSPPTTVTTASAGIR